MANGSVRIDVDTSGAQKNVQALIDRFNGMTKPLTTASNAVAGYVDDMKKAGQSLTTVSKKQVEMASALGKVNTASQAPRQALSELKKTLESVTVAYNSLTSQEKASPFGQALKGSINELTGRAKTLQSDLKDVSDSLKDTNTKANEGGSIMDKLSSKLGVSIKSFLSFNGAAAAAGAALKVAKDAFMTSEENVDAWGRTMEAASSAYQGFCTALNSGDLGNFFSNLQNIIDKAKEAYDAIDDLETKGGKISRKESYLNYQLQKQEAIVNDKSATEAQRKAAQQQIKVINQQMRGAKQQTATLNNNVVKAKINELLTDAGLDPKSSAYKDAYKRVVKGMYDPNYKMGSVTATRVQKFMTGKSSVTTKSVNLDNLVTDEWLADIDPYVKAVWQSLSDAESGTRMANRFAQKTITTNTPRTSHTTSTTTTKTGPEFTENAVSTKQMSDNISVLTTALSTLDTKSKEYLDTLQQVTYWQNKLKDTQTAAKDVSDLYSGKVGKGVSIVDMYKDTAEPDKNFKISEDKLPDVTKMKNPGSGLAKAGSSAADAWQAAASAISSAGSAMQGLGDTGLNIAGIIAQAIANIAMGMASMLASPASTAGGPWTWVAAAAAGVATMISTIAAIHSATGYAEGGVVGGNSYSGDRLYARLNSGEVVLNQNQIARANSALDNSAGNASRSTIRGEQIISVLRATTRRRGKSLGEIL